MYLYILLSVLFIYRVTCRFYNYSTNTTITTRTTTNNVNYKAYIIMDNKSFKGGKFIVYFPFQF